MKQAVDTRTRELPAIDTPQPARSMLTSAATRGPYGGRYNKPETQRMRVRHAAGLTMAELAELAQVSERTVRNWESGCGKPSTDVLVRLELVLARTRAPLADVRAACRRQTGNGH